MIVRPHAGGVQLITQPDHAALAAHIMRAWRRDNFQSSGRRADVLLAIEEHDNGWRETDQRLFVDSATGKLFDFATMPDEERRAVWPRSIRRLGGTPYAAALVAHHASHIYRRYRGEPSWEPFFADMERIREHHLELAGMRNADDLRRDYVFLRIADLASLTFCCGWTTPQQDDSGLGYSMHVEGDRLLINPDPFFGKEVALSVPARTLAAERFASAAEAEQAFARATPAPLTGTARGA